LGSKEMKFESFDFLLYSCFKSVVEKLRVHNNWNFGEAGKGIRSGKNKALLLGISSTDIRLFILKVLWSSIYSTTGFAGNS